MNNSDRQQPTTAKETGKQYADPRSSQAKREAEAAAREAETAACEAETAACEAEETTRETATGETSAAPSHEEGPEEVRDAGEARPEAEPFVFDESYPTLETCDLSLFTIDGTILKRCSIAAKGEIRVPYGVTQIVSGSEKYSAFQGCIDVTAIILPPTVTHVEFASFSHLPKLKKLVLSDKLKEITDAMCQGCSELESIVIHEGVSSIGANAFFDCRALKEVTFPSSLRFIGDFAFGNCIKITKLTVPSCVEKLDSCFYGCSGLTSLTIGRGVKRIESIALQDCTSLQTLILPTRFMLKKKALNIPKSAKVIFKNV